MSRCETRSHRAEAHSVHVVLLPPLQDARHLRAGGLRARLLLLVASHAGKLREVVRLLKQRPRLHERRQRVVDGQVFAAQLDRLLQLAVSPAGSLAIDRRLDNGGDDGDSHRASAVRPRLALTEANRRNDSPVRTNRDHTPSEIRITPYADCHALESMRLLHPCSFRLLLCYKLSSRVPKDESR